MKSILALVGAFAVAGVLLAGIWFGDRPVQAPEEQVPAGPPGKAVVDEASHAFGTMLVGDTDRHAFVIRNEGEGPLVLQKGKTSCKCALSQLKDGTVAPGESVEVELAWTPKEAAREFRQTAVIHVQNDPDRREILLAVHGTVTTAIEIVPREEWNLGTIAEDRPTTVTGTIHSALLGSFEILEVAGEHDYLTGEAVPLSAERLAELGAKSGYELRATLEPRMPAEQFREKLVVRTDVAEHEALELYVVGNRPGPAEFLPLAGFTYHPDVRAFDLGSFAASAGKSATLLMFVDADTEFRVEIIKRDPEFLDVSVTENEDYREKGRRQFRIVVAVPPGSPPMARLQRDSGKVLLKTTHPKLPELKFHVQFVAY
ncbi:MAG: DUF1573 domain-containing protein [Planctomycetales bacterium]